MSVIVDLATKLASAIDDLEIFSTEAVVEMIPSYDTTSTTDVKVVVTPSESNYERAGRLDFKHELSLLVSVYQYVGNTEVESVEELIDKMEQLALDFANATLDVDDVTYVVTNTYIDALYDSTQLEQNFVYSGMMTLTFTRVGMLSES